MAELKDAGVMVRLAYQSMQDLGIDTDEVFRRANVSTDCLYDSQLRTPHWAQSVFWRVTESVSGDANIGLHIGEKIPLSKGHLLDHLFNSAANYGDGLRRMISYQRLLSDAFTARLVEQGEEAFLGFSYKNCHLQHLIDCTLIATSRTLLANSDRALAAVRVDVAHSGRGDVNAYAALFGCPVRFNQPENRLYFRRQALAGRSIYSQPELSIFHTQCADAQLAELERQDLLADVQRYIAELLEGGGMSISDVASRMQISDLQLRESLEAAGTSFSQLLNNYRHQLSTRLLLDTDNSIAEIVYQTGFAEPSTFYRAFKRWEGITPIAYRGT